MVEVKVKGTGKVYKFDLAKATKLVKSYPDQGESARQANFEKGFVFERLLSRAYGDGGPVRTDELEVDGILLSPDGFWVYEGTDCVCEYKCTVRSEKHPIEDNIRWRFQISAYCRAMYCNYALLHVLYLAGNWNPPSVPLYKRYWLEFSDSELTETWDMIVRHAKRKGMLK